MTETNKPVDEKLKKKYEREANIFKYGCFGFLALIILGIIIIFAACTNSAINQNNKDTDTYYEKYSNPDDYNHDGKVNYDDAKDKLKDSIKQDEKKGK